MSDPWTFEIGERPTRVSALERTDRGGVVYLRWWDAGRGNWRQSSTKLKVRNRKGDLVQRRITDAIRATKARHASLVSAVPMPEGAERPLSIVEGVDKALHPKSGGWAKPGRNRTEVRCELERVANILGHSRAWNDLRPGDVRTVYRTRRKQLAAKGHTGKRAAELTVARMLAVAAWLRGEGVIDYAACHPPTRWKINLAKDYDDPPPHQPRHSLEEMRRILKAAPLVDPRLAFLYRVGIGLRLGQVVRCTRADLDMEAGTLRVPGKGNKHGTTVALLDEDRVVVQAALNGYLAPLESLLKAEQIPNYPLVPAGPLRGGRVDSRTATVRPEQATAGPVCMSAVRKWFRRAEDLAGVPHERGRSTYGMKRQAVDTAKNLEVGRDTLTALGGWADPQMADRVYAEQGSAVSARKAAEARAAIRGEG